ncbi:MAG TPA: GNAT family protein [Sphingomicrobium sp.]|jgi:RimJ/RimL family protein N-acetyltransferase
MDADTYEVAPATEADIAEMMRIESDPRYDGLVGRWPRDRHLEEMERRSSRYFLLRGPSGEVAGFALLQGYGDEDLKLHLKRIVVREPGAGHGSILLRALLDRVFSETDTNRVDLDLFIGNERACRAYEKAGFQSEGVLRDWHRNSDGSFSSMRLMSVLRRDWEQRARG